MVHLSFAYINKSLDIYMIQSSKHSLNLSFNLLWLHWRRSPVVHLAEIFWYADFFFHEYKTSEIFLVCLLVASCPLIWLPNLINALYGASSVEVGNDISRAWFWHSLSLAWLCVAMNGTLLFCTQLSINWTFPNFGNRCSPKYPSAWDCRERILLS